LSLLESLGAKRAAVIAKQQKVITLPRWESEGIVVSITYKLADRETLKKIGKLGEAKRDKDDALFNFYLQFHVDHAIKIEFDDGKEHVVFDKFGDDELGEALRVEPKDEENPDLVPPSARKNVNALFVSDFDVIAFGDSIIEWSGTTRDQIEEASAGE
jgi:hypothetical protein